MTSDVGRLNLATMLRLNGCMMNKISALTLLFAAGIASNAMATDIAMDTVVLGGLDKVAARVNTVTSKVGAPVMFGTLEIVARTCVTRPPEETPENAAFLEVFESQPGKEKQKLFSGWMFGSSPALSALDHPVYDVWVLGCESSSKAK